MTNENKIERWNNIHAILFSCLFVLYTVFPSRFPVIIAGVLSFAIYWTIHFNTLKKIQPFAGYANWTTLTRLVLVFVAGLYYKNIPDFVMFLIGFTIFCFDGLDGFLARKLKQESKFGAYFDMETDAFYVCVFAVILFEKGYAGYWILLPGFMRYLYGSIILLIGRKSKENIRTKFGPLIAGIFFVSILSPFILSPILYIPILFGASFLLFLSFIYSFLQNLGLVSN